MEMEDRLSALPDSVLRHILSFLPTHDAIATSLLLSKRWQHLWLAVAALDLDAETFLRTGSSYTSFFKFAFAALLSHDASHPLKRARLRLNSESVPANNDLPYPKFQTMPKLVSAVICNGVSYRSLSRVKTVCNVEYLKFSHLNHKESFPEFHNLIHLEFNFGSCIMWQTVFEMLNHCPKLQTLVLHRLPNFALSNRQNWYCPESVPECISSQLRKCTILDYEGKEYEFQFAKYIMQSAQSLQTMSIHNLTISDANSPNPQDKLRMLQELAMCPRTSTTCKLSFK